MKEIVTTPIEQDLYVVGFRKKDEKIEDFPFYKALNTPGKHLYIEYDENNLCKVMLDLDAMGLEHIKSVEELEKILPQLRYEVQS